jgi:hypothetical protein
VDERSYSLHVDRHHKCTLGLRNELIVNLLIPLVTGDYAGRIVLRVAAVAVTPPDSSRIFEGLGDEG